MELFEIRYFLALCETLNFTRAAERCHISQPALSRAIGKLEQELGGQLIRRERGRTHLTDLGQIMRPYFESVVRDVDGARRAADDFGALRDAALRLGLSRDVPAARVGAFLRAFRRGCPGVRLEIRDMDPLHQAPALLDGGIDVAILGGGSASGERLRLRPLFAEPLCVALACDDPLAAHPVVAARYLRGRRCYLPFAPEDCRNIEVEFAKAGLELNLGMAGSRLDLCMALALDRIAVALLPEGCDHGPEIVTRRLVEPALDRVISVATVAGRPHTPPLAVLLKALGAYRWGTARAPGSALASGRWGELERDTAIGALWRAWWAVASAKGGLPPGRNLAAATKDGVVAPFLVQADILGGGVEARYRKVGAEVCRRFGRDPSGELVGEALPGEYRNHILDLNRQISRLGRPVYAESLYRWDCGAEAVTRRLFCPALDEAGRVGVGFSAQVFEEPEAGWNRTGPLLRSAGRMDVLRLEVLTV